MVIFDSPFAFDQVMVIQTRRRRKIFRLLQAANRLSREDARVDTAEGAFL
jgi:hypothetical protein